MNRERYILQKREYEYRKQLKLKTASGQPLTFKERNVLNIILKNERKGK